MQKMKMNNKPRIIFYGTPAFSVPTLEQLINNSAWEIVAVITQPDRPSGRGKKLQHSPIKDLALKHNLPVLQPENIKREIAEFLSELQMLAPIDLAVVLAFGQIIPLSVLEFPKNGSVNVHASLLPRWRGAAPIHRAIEAGDSETGVCLMKMEAGLDTGPVYSSRTIPIKTNETTGTLHDRLARLSAEIIKADLLKIINQELSLTPQNSNLATYAKKISRAEEKINWNQSAKTIHNKIRAFSPFPGAYTSYQDKILKILDSEVRTEPHQHTAGQIIYVDKTTLEIACQNSSLIIKSIKAEGKRIMTTQEYLQGNNFQTGEQFK